MKPATFARHQSRTPPPMGLDRVQAILREQHGRDVRRNMPGTLRQCAEALDGLRSDAAAKRAGAATILGDLRYLHSYAPLLDALARECQPGLGDRAVKAAILEALEHVGSDHCRSPKLEAGREPLNRFMMAHLADPELVRSALNALRWTGLFGDTIEDTCRIEEAAAQHGYHETEAVANDVYVTRTRERG
jgi:hypothetical protein